MQSMDGGYSTASYHFLVRNKKGAQLQEIYLQQWPYSWVSVDVEGKIYTFANSFKGGESGWYILYNGDLEYRKQKENESQHKYRARAAADVAIADETEGEIPDATFLFSGESEYREGGTLYYVFKYWPDRTPQMLEYFDFSVTVTVNASSSVVDSIKMGNRTIKP